jgi:phenylpyruvate tautomerase
MPLIQVFTSASPPAASGAAALLADLSRLAAQQFGKPERWVMTCLVPGLTMTFGGSPDPAAFVAVKNIGKMTPDQTATLSKEICGRLEAALKIPAARVYIDFQDAVDYQWGWNGGTFG